MATPIAGVLGMIVAFLVVRRKFSGKEALDFVSNLGAAVPGTILGIGFIIAFIRPPLPALILVFVAFLLYLMSNMQVTRAHELLSLVLGLGPGLAAGGDCCPTLVAATGCALSWGWVWPILLWLVGRRRGGTRAATDRSPGCCSCRCWACLPSSLGPFS